MNNLTEVRKLRGKEADEVLIHSPTFKAEWDFYQRGEYCNDYPEGSAEYKAYNNVYDDCALKEFV